MKLSEIEKLNEDRVISGHHSMEIRVQTSEKDEFTGEAFSFRTEFLYNHTPQMADMLVKLKNFEITEEFIDKVYSQDSIINLRFDERAVKNIWIAVLAQLIEDLENAKS